MLKVAQLATLVEKPLRPEVVRIRPQLAVNVHRVEISDEHGVFGQRVAAQLGVT